jgi:hypothetical protein
MSSFYEQTIPGMLTQGLPGRLNRRHKCPESEECPFNLAYILPPLVFPVEP